MPTPTSPPIDRNRIREAWRRIAGRVRQTPVIDVEVAGRAINLKESARSAAIVQAVAAHRPYDMQHQSSNREE